MLGRRSHLVLAKDSLFQNFEDENLNLCPLTDFEFLRSVDEVFTPFISFVSSQEDSAFDILMGDFRFLVFFCQHLHMRRLEKVCREKKVDLILDATQRKIVNPDWNKFGNEYKSWLINRSRARQWASIFYKNMSLVGHPRNLCNLLSGNLGWALALGEGERLRNDYSLLQSVQSVQYEPWLHLRDSQISGQLTKKWQSKFVEPYLDVLSPDLNGILSESDKKLLTSAWARRLSEVENIYETFIEAKKYFPLMLVNGGTNPFRKIMMLAYQRSGVRTILFHHGHDFGGRVQRYGHLGEVSHSRRFICPTHWIASNYRKAYQNEVVEKRTGTRYESVGSNYFQEIYEESKKFRKENSTSNQYFMVMGRPINDRRLLDASGGFLVHKVALEFKLIQLLKLGRHQVLYKAHPESAIYANSLFKSQCTVSSTPLEKIYCSASCLIFTTATSTAFGFAMATTVPIVLVEHKDNVWQEHVRREVSRRCAMIQYSEDDRASALLSLDCLNQAVEEARQKASDTGFLNELTQKHRKDLS